MSSNQLIWQAQSKNDWIQQILSENPGKTIDSFYSITDDEISCDPFAFISDVKHSIQIDFPLNPFWKSGIVLRPAHSVELTEMTQMSLLNGIEYLHIYLDKIENPEHLSNALQGVFTDAVEISFMLNADHPNLQAYIRYFCNEEHTSRFNIFSTNQNIGYHNGLLFDLHSNCQSAVDLLHQLISNENLDNQKIFIRHLLTNDFLKNIYFTRAFYIVLQNLSELFPCTKMKHLACMDVHCLSDNPYENSVKYSCMAVAAALSGYDCMLLESADALKPSTDLRWLKSSIHLQHIIRKESKLEGFIDPLKGSYFLDKMTIAYAERMWDQLRTLNKA